MVDERIVDEGTRENRRLLFTTRELASRVGLTRTTLRLGCQTAMNVCKKHRQHISAWEGEENEGTFSIRLLSFPSLIRVLEQIRL